MVGSILYTHLAVGSTSPDDDSLVERLEGTAGERRRNSMVHDGRQYGCRPNHECRRDRPPTPARERKERATPSLDFGIEVLGVVLQRARLRRRRPLLARRGGPADPLFQKEHTRRRK